MSDIPEFSGREDFQQWLCRSCQTSAGVWLVFGRAGGPKPLRASEAPEEALVERIALREAIDQLPEKERMTILLRYFKGLTQERTARVLGVSQVQVSRLERRGLKRLRESFGP